MADQTTAQNSKLYKRRWIVLAVFCSYSATNAFQWLQYATINNIISEFYAQPSWIIDWLSMIYMLLYIPLIFPANWLLDKYGLRPVVLLGSFGNALGAVIKIASAKRQLFAVTFVGQTIASISQTFILGIPAELSAIWFGPKEVSTATAIGVLGNQVGNALGFLLPPVFVPNPEPWDEEVVANHLLKMFCVIGGVTVMQFFLVVLVIPGKPPHPPSRAQAAVSSGTAGKKSHFLTIKHLLKDLNFMLLVFSYGISVGVFVALSTLLNQMLLSYYPGQEVNIGRVGLLIVVTGMLGSVIIGIWLDRTHTYKLTTLVIYILTLAGAGGFAISIPIGRLWLVFVTAGLLGLFMSSYLPLGFELAAEITYPSSEALTSGLLMASVQIFGIILTIVGGRLLTYHGVKSCMYLLCGVLALGSVMTAFIVENQRRRRAELGLTSTVTHGLSSSDRERDDLSKF